MNRFLLPIRRPSFAVAAVAALSLLTACESTPLGGAKAPLESRNPVLASAQPPSAATGAVTGATAPQSPVATVDLGAGAGTRGGAVDPALAAAAAQRVVYFDYDSFAIKDEFKPMLDAHARLMAGPPLDRRVVVEGHTDARGSSEYNLALGQKRADAVVRSLMLLGVGANRLEAVSFGDQRPAVQGNDEQAYARNRRAELKDR